MKITCDGSDIETYDSTKVASSGTTGGGLGSSSEDLANDLASNSSNETTSGSSLTGNAITGSYIKSVTSTLKSNKDTELTINSSDGSDTITIPSVILQNFNAISNGLGQKITLGLNNGSSKTLLLNYDSSMISTGSPKEKIKYCTTVKQALDSLADAVANTSNDSSIVNTSLKNLTDTKKYGWKFAKIKTKWSARGTILITGKSGYNGSNTGYSWLFNLNGNYTDGSWIGLGITGVLLISKTTSSVTSSTATDKQKQNVSISECYLLWEKANNSGEYNLYWIIPSGATYTSYDITFIASGGYNNSTCQMEFEVLEGNYLVLLGSADDIPAPDGTTYWKSYISRLPDATNVGELTGVTKLSGDAIKSYSTITNLGWSNDIGYKIPTLNAIAYWNGAYSGTTSNLLYTAKGKLGDACAKGVDTTVTSGSANLVTSGAVYTAILDATPIFKTLTIKRGTTSLGTYNGTADKTITITLPTFAEVTSKPTTLSGYGITDAYTKTDTDKKFVGRNFALGTSVAFTVTGAANLTQWFYKGVSGNLAEKSGATITVSFDYDASAVTAGTVPVMLFTVWQNIITIAAGATGHASKSFTLSKDINSTSCFLYAQGTWTGKVVISNCKVELGNRETEWCPAPEDAIVRTGDTMTGSLTIKKNALGQTWASDGGWLKVLDNTDTYPRALGLAIRGNNGAIQASVIGKGATNKLELNPNGGQIVINSTTISGTDGTLSVTGKITSSGLTTTKTLKLSDSASTISTIDTAVTESSANTGLPTSKAVYDLVTSKMNSGSSSALTDAKTYTNAYAVPLTRLKPWYVHWNSSKYGAKICTITLKTQGARAVLMVSGKIGWNGSNSGGIWMFQLSSNYYSASTGNTLGISGSMLVNSVDNTKAATKQSTGLPGAMLRAKWISESKYELYWVYDSAHTYTRYSFQFISAEDWDIDTTVTYITSTDGLPTVDNNTYNGVIQAYVARTPDANNYGAMTGASISNSGNIKTTTLNVTGASTLTGGITAGSTIEATGTISSKANIIAYATNSSDNRLKKNIHPMKDGMDVIQNLQPVRFKWNDKAEELTGGTLKNNDDGVGFIAQEALSVDCPGLVFDMAGTEYLGMRYEKIVPALVNAVLELAAEVRELKKKLNG